MHQLSIILLNMKLCVSQESLLTLLPSIVGRFPPPELLSYWPGDLFCTSNYVICALVNSNSGQPNQTPLYLHVHLYSLYETLVECRPGTVSEMGLLWWLPYLVELCHLTDHYSQFHVWNSYSKKIPSLPVIFNVIMAQVLFLTQPNKILGFFSRGPHVITRELLKEEYS